MERFAALATAGYADFSQRLEEECVHVVGKTGYGQVNI